MVRSSAVLITEIQRVRSGVGLVGRGVSRRLRGLSSSALPLHNLISSPFLVWWWGRLYAPSGSVWGPPTPRRADDVATARVFP